MAAKCHNWFGRGMLAEKTAVVFFVANQFRIAVFWLDRGPFEIGLLSRARTHI